MSHWQHKNTHKNLLLWLKLWTLCLSLHCIVLGLIFFAYDNASHSVALTLNKHVDYTAPIVFVPINASITQKEEPVSEQSTVTDIPSPSTQQPDTTITPIKKESEKPVPKIQEIPPITPVIPIKKEASIQQTDTSTATKKQTPVVPANAHVSHNYKEVEALRRNALLQKELINNWHPPLGMPEKTSCEISFYVDAHGVAKNITIVKSSNIMMYDISARHAVFTMKMPQWTYKKTITINFTQ